MTRIWLFAHCCRYPSHLPKTHSLLWAFLFLLLSSIQTAEILSHHFFFQQISPSLAQSGSSHCSPTCWLSALIKLTSISPIWLTKRCLALGHPQSWHKQVQLWQSDIKLCAPRIGLIPLMEASCSQLFLKAVSWLAHVRRNQVSSRWTYS